MALSNTQLSIVEAIRGKIRNLRQMKKKDACANLLIVQTVNKINGLITTYDLSEAIYLLEEVHITLIKLKKYGLANSFLRKHTILMKNKRL